MKMDHYNGAACDTQKSPLDMNMCSDGSKATPNAPPPTPKFPDADYHSNCGQFSETLGIQAASDIGNQPCFPMKSFFNGLRLCFSLLGQYSISLFLSWPSLPAAICVCSCGAPCAFMIAYVTPLRPSKCHKEKKRQKAFSCMIQEWVI